jgi:hypothetical protein
VTVAHRPAGWALAVWWLGEGLGGVLAGGASPGRTFAAMASGQRGWISAMDHAAAGLLAHGGVAVPAVLAVVLLVVAVGVFLPGPAARAILVLAVAVAALIWVAGENFGGVFTGSGTDPNSGPLLALLAAAYWPRAAGLRRAGDARTGDGQADGPQEPVGEKAAGEKPVRGEVAP